MNSINIKEIEQLLKLYEINYSVDNTKNGNIYCNGKKIETLEQFKKCILLNKNNTL